MTIRTITAVDTDSQGRCWPLFQFGPIESEAEAQAILEELEKFFDERFGRRRPRTLKR